MSVDGLPGPGRSRGKTVEDDLVDNFRGREVARVLATIEIMKTMPVSEAKDQLSALVEAVEEIHETVVITRHGKPAAVLVSPDEFESLAETAFWTSVPGIADDLTEAQTSIERGERVSVADLRALLAERRAGA